MYRQRWLQVSCRSMINGPLLINSVLRSEHINTCLHTVHTHIHIVHVETNIMPCMDHVYITNSACENQLKVLFGPCLDPALTPFVFQVLSRLYPTTAGPVLACTGCACKDGQVGHHLVKTSIVSHKRHRLTYSGQNGQLMDRIRGLPLRLRFSPGRV